MTEFETAVQICKILQNSGYETVICGGWVRDNILGKNSSDIDIATTADSSVIIPLLDLYGFTSKIVGESFEVTLVKRCNFEFEIAMFRKDIFDETNGRHPSSVCKATMKEDAERRDFTMNAIFYDPVAKKHFDFVDGINDVNNQQLRFVGNAEDRIKEDYLRILRYFRFMCRLYDPIYNEFELQTVNRMSADLLKYVSPERIQDELMKKIFKGDIFEVSFSFLVRFPILFQVLFPEVWALKDIEQDKKYHPEVWALNHTMICFESLYEKNANPLLLLAGLFHDTGKAVCTKVIDGKIISYGHEVESEKITRDWMARFKFSTKDIDHVCSLVKDHMKLHSYGMKKSTLRKLMAKDYFEDLLKLVECDILASSNFFDILNDYKKKIEEIKDHTLPAMLVTGDDLIKLGMKPSEKFGKILNFLYDEQLEGVFNTKKDGIHLLLKNGSQFDILY